MADSDQFRRSDIDAYFGARLWRQFDIDIFRGITDYELRQARIAEAIVKYGIENSRIARGETWQEAYERLYQTKLNRKSKDAA